MTGEDNSYRGTTPARNFDPVEVPRRPLGRLRGRRRATPQLGVDEDDVYTLGFANPTRSARKAKAWAIGVNWYLNRMVRLMLDFDRTTFTGGAANGGDRDPKSC